MIIGTTEISSRSFASLSPQGEYVFLEANPSPMFLHVESQTGFPITQELVKRLMN
ncbi:hypothetical protein MC7420_4953 [Coleofasciculus chthonoplastes PCC 7420]|uniref:ATP-grasp domain-containing protein n=1 Tax=Coleofasciculus chthonoplastes PCC 7420 TaxID=118168 RepID=B4VZB6_9CYAN|nr:hypothetical protein [Coleofasciculus chthonoplastes]EDX72680.1 hypothetical protein MC7420_4953 [Coleofasciculus chthonoplastes PCC 7420]